MSRRGWRWSESDAHAANGTEHDTVNNESGTGAWSYYTLDKSASGINVDQTIMNSDGSFALWKFDAYGAAWDVQATATDKSWTETFFSNGQASTLGWDWERYSYNSSGAMTDQIVHATPVAFTSANAGSTVLWTEDKYYPPTSGDPLEEQDLHYADSTGLNTYFPVLSSQTFIYYTVTMNAAGQGVTQTVANPDGSYTVYPLNPSGGATSANILQPDGSWSNVTYSSNGAASENFYDKTGHQTKGAIFNGQGGVYVVDYDSSGHDVDEISYSANGQAIETLHNVSGSAPWSTETQFYTNGVLTKTVELDTNGIEKDVVTNSDGSFTLTLIDNTGLQNWSEQVQSYSASSTHGETQTLDIFRDGSSLNTTYDSSGLATEIVTKNADGSASYEQITPTGNAYGHDTTTTAYNSSGVLVEAAYADYDGDVTVQTFSGNATKNIKLSEVDWFNSTTSTHNPDDTYTYEYYADGGLDSARTDYATGAVVVTSFYDSGSASVNGPAKSLVRLNADGSGTVIGYDLITGKTSEVDQNADGSKTVKGWNTTAASPWTSYVITYNADGSMSDAQFILKDSIQSPSTGVWSSTLTLYDSNSLTDHSVLLMTKAELIEENQAQAANNKHDVQQRVTLPDGENYLITVKADGSIYAKNEHGSTFEAIFNDVVLVVSVVVDIYAALTGQIYLIAAVEAVDGVIQLTEGNVEAGIIDLISAVAVVGVAGAGGFGTAAAVPYEAVLAGMGIGEGLQALIIGVENGNILEAASGVLEAAGAAVLGFGSPSVNTIIGIEVGEAVLGTADALANGNVVGGIAAAIGGIGGVYAAENPATGNTAASADKLTNDAATTETTIHASGDGNTIIWGPATVPGTPTSSTQLAANVPSAASVRLGITINGPTAVPLTITTTYEAPPSDIQSGTISASYTPVQNTPAATTLAPISPVSYTATSTEPFSNPYVFLPILAVLALADPDELEGAALVGSELADTVFPELAEEVLALESRGIIDQAAMQAGRVFETSVQKALLRLPTSRELRADLDIHEAP